MTAGHLPVWRGLTLSADDRVRGAVISHLMCQGAIDVAGIEARYGIDFADYSATRSRSCNPTRPTGSCGSGGQITATAPGRLLLRSVPMCFDPTLGPARAMASAPVPCSRAV